MKKISHFLILAILVTSCQRTLDLPYPSISISLKFYDFDSKELNKSVLNIEGRLSKIGQKYEYYSDYLTEITALNKGTDKIGSVYILKNQPTSPNSTLNFRGCDPFIGRGYFFEKQLRMLLLWNINSGQ